MAKRSQRTCVFCGRTPVTREHVWPQWIGRDLIPPIPLPPSRERAPRVLVHTRASDDGSTVIVQPQTRGLAPRPHDALVKVVCKRCNNGWMADLEGAVKPTILALESGEAVHLDDATMQTLALWAAKTSAMFQYNDHFSRVVTPQQLAAMYEYRKPPEGVEVWLGRIENAPEWRMRLRHSGGTVATSASVALGKPRPIGRAGATTITVESSLFYVTTVSAPQLGGSPPRTPAMAPLWPARGEINWPLPALPPEAVLGLTMKAHAMMPWP